MTRSENNSFSYSYSAKEQEEIKAIRAKYIPKEENKLDRLRRLDASATRKGTITALMLGILSALLLGLGMSCTLVWAGKWFIPGIVIGVVGIAGIVSAYPLYKYLVRKERARLTQEILQLTDELLR